MEATAEPDQREQRRSASRRSLFREARGLAECSDLPGRSLDHLETAFAQNGGDARLVLVTGLRGATVRSAKLGMRTGWNAAAACHRAGLAGTFGVMEN